MASKFRNALRATLSFLALVVGSTYTMAALHAVEEARMAVEIGTAYPESIRGYWQGTMAFGPKEHRRRVRAEFVFGYGRRLSPPDTTLPMAERQSVVWETISSDFTGKGAGRFCEVLSFSSHSRIEFDEMSDGDATAGTRASLMTMAGTVCGIYNRTDEKLFIAWSTSPSTAYPDSFESTTTTHVAELQMLSSDVIPPELEGKWSGFPLVPTKTDEKGVFEQGEAAAQMTCASGRCLYIGPRPGLNGQEDAVTEITDIIFFQRAGASKGKFCEFVTFSNQSMIEVANDKTHGRVQYGTQVHCNLYKRIGNTLVVAWGEDPSGFAPQNLRPGPQSKMVATFDLEAPAPKNLALQGHWKGHIRSKATDKNPTHTRYIELSCSESRCVYIDPYEGPEGVKIMTAITGENELVRSGTGKLCEIVSGGTSAAVNALTVSLGHPFWDQLGRVKCSFYRRKGRVLEITPAKALESPEGFLVLPQDLEAESVIVLEPMDSEMIGSQGSTKSGNENSIQEFLAPERNDPLKLFELVVGTIADDDPEQPDMTLGELITEPVQSWDQPRDGVKDAFTTDLAERIRQWIGLGGPQRVAQYVMTHQDTSESTSSAATIRLARIQAMLFYFPVLLALFCLL